MSPILSATKQKSIKTLSANWMKKVPEAGGKTAYDQLAEEVEESKLAPLLGTALFQDVQDNPTSTANVKILEGGEFTDCNGNTVKFKGAEYILAYFNFVQTVSESFVSATYTGYVKKGREEAVGLSSSERKELRINAQALAVRQWELLKQFLNENYSDYPLWVPSQSRRPLRPRLTGIKKTIN